MVKKKAMTNPLESRENLILCSKTLNDCGVVLNRELDSQESITLNFNLHFQDNSLIYDDDKEVELNKRQIVLYKLITFMRKEKGMSYRKICAWFNRMNIRTYKGKRWSETGSHAHMIVKRMKQRKKRLHERTFKTDSQITDFKIGEHYE